MKFNKIFSMLALGALAATMAACSDDEPQRGESPVPNSDGVYFAAPATEDVDLTTDQTSFEVTIYREKKDKELTVSLSTAMAEENAPFTVPTSVTFPAGVSEVAIDVAVDFANVEANKTYSMQISVGDAQGTPYALDAKTLNVVYAPWTDWKYMGIGRWTFSLALSGYANIHVFERQSLVDSDIYQYQAGSLGMADVPAADQGGVAPGNFDVNFIVEYNKKTGLVTFGPQYTGFDYNQDGTSGQVWVADIYTFCKDVMPSFAGGTPVDNFKQLSSFNSETGLFTVNCRYYLSNQPSMGFGSNGEEFFQLPGYTSYNVSVALNGHYITEAGDEAQIVTIAMSETVAEVKYGVFDGKLSDAEAEAKAKELAADADAPSIREGGNVAIVLQPGNYTVVAAGLDESGNYRTFDYVAFEYVSVKVDPNAGWTSKGMVSYTDDIMPSLYRIEMSTYQVEIQESDDTPGLYRLVNPYKTAWPYWDSLGQSLSNGKDNYIVINASNPNAVFIEESPLNYSDEDGDYYVTSRAAMFLSSSNPPTLAQIAAAGYCGKFEDGKITMPSSIDPKDPKGILVLIGEGAYLANRNGGFCVNFNGDEEEEESINIPMSVKVGAVNNKKSGNKTNLKRGSRKSYLISNDEWLKARKVRPGRMF